MLQIIIIVIAVYICGMSAGRRGIPVSLGVVGAIMAGGLGGVLLGLLGTAVACFLTTVLFVLIPIPEDERRGSRVRRDAGEVSEEISCPNCQRIMSADSRICPRCMTRLDGGEVESSGLQGPTEKTVDENPYSPPKAVRKCLTE